MCASGIDTEKLQNVKPLDGGAIRAACPACRAAGSDKTGDHLLIQADGKFGCATHPDDREHRKEIFKLAGTRLTPVPATNGHAKRNGSPAKPNAAFDWQVCVTNFSESDAQKLAAWRGLSVEFVRWLHAQGVVGIFDGKTAFANHGDGGEVVSCHVRLSNGKWIFEPKGKHTAPLVFGDVKAAGHVLIFESQWDAFAIMDKFGWHTGNGLPDTAIFITRGAGNGKLIRGQVSPDAVCYAFKQNDAPTPKEPIPAGDIWLADVASNAGCKVLNVATPAPHKDCNDWTRARATRADLEAAMKSAKPVVSGPSEKPENPLPEIDNAAALCADDSITLPPEIILGVLHQGLKAVLGSNAKARKTWILLDAAISVATGTKFWKWDTQKGKVLYINFEIPRAFIRSRIKQLCEAKGIDDVSNLDVWTLRGHAAPFGQLLPALLDKIKAGNYSLVIIDPIYKGLGGRDENSAGDIGELCNELEKLAVQTGAAVLYAAHFSKGNQAGKEAIDRISGSGVFGRDADSLMILTKHETPDAYTVDLILRNLPEQPSFVVQWEYPVMVEATELDPARLKQAGGRKPEHVPGDLLALLPPGGLENKAWLEVADKNGISRRTFYRLRKELQKAGKILDSVAAGKWQPILKK